MRIKIGNRFIGDGCACFIIAECGANHNGDVKLAKRLIDAARGAGVDAVKFQTFSTEKLVTKKIPKLLHQMSGKGDKESYYDMMRKLELSEKDHMALKDYAESSGLVFLSTPHSGGWSVDLLEKVGVPAYKIGSGDLTNLPFLSYLAAKKKPVILSTGMSDMKEIKSAIEAIKERGNNNIVLLHATTQYPCSDRDVNLCAMNTLRQKFGLLTGYSDHTLGIEIPTAAAALGARVIEKHITLDKKMKGPDHAFSLEPEELKKMVSAVRRVEKAMGTGEKRPCGKEKKVARIVRKGIKAKIRLPRGTKLTADLLEIKRPATGLAPRYFNEIIGRIVKRDIEEEQPVEMKDLE